MASICASCLLFNTLYATKAPIDITTRPPTTPPTIAPINAPPEGNYPGGLT